MRELGIIWIFVITLSVVIVGENDVSYEKDPETIRFEINMTTKSKLRITI